MREEVAYREKIQNMVQKLRNKDTIKSAIFKRLMDTLYNVHEWCVRMIRRKIKFSRFLQNSSS